MEAARGTKSWRGSVSMRPRSAFLLPICQACDVGTSLALVEPHPTDAELELRTFRCPLCGSQETYETERRK